MEGACRLVLERALARKVAYLVSPVSQSQIDRCDLEPVNFIGAIQPFGALLAYDETNGNLRYASKHWQETFGPTAPKLSELTSPTIHGQSWVGNVFRRNGLVVLEAEKMQPEPDLRIERTALDRLQKSNSLAELLQICAESVAAITGMDRVMIYKFHADLHGEVVAEKVKPGTESFLGLHYPASDIPAPARALFLQSWVRMIPRVDYQPIPIEALDGSGSTFDLGGSLLRAVSPIHLEYLRNMKVGASLTISLQHEGKLWGLIACHTANPHYVPPATRAACESVGRFTSACIAAKTEQDQLSLQARYREVHDTLTDRLHAGQDMGMELTKFSPNLLDLISAAGSSAALYLSGTWVSVGKVPSEEQLEKLVDWLEAKYLRQPLFTTDQLPSLYPEAAAFKATACGLLALQIPKTNRNYILWFRPEVIETVSWAGKPEKMEDQSGRLHPRGSFSLWQQEVEGHSKPWTELECGAAMELRNAIMAVDLQVQFRKEQAARADAERSMSAREELMAVLSHDLKNPVGSIKINAALASRFLNAGNSEKLPGILDRINRASTNMNNLIDDILSITKLESGHLDVEFRKEDVNTLLQEVDEMLQPLALEKKIQMVTELPEQTCVAEVDRGTVLQVFSNLIGNAIKFTPEGGKITVRLEKCGPENVKFVVQDTGPGIDPNNLLNIFDRFWQAKQTRRLGTGLGLAIAKGIVQAHGGSIWAESDGKTGTIVHVTIPISRPS